MKNCRVWIIYSENIIKARKKHGYFDKMIRFAKENNIDLEIKSADKFIVVAGSSNDLYYDGKQVNDLPDYVIMRRFEIYLGRTLEKNGVKVINSVQSMVDTRNKMKIHQILSENGIRTPKTIYLINKNFSNNNYDYVTNILGSNKFIVKYIFGSEGTDIFLIETKEEFDELNKKYAGKILCQEYIESSYGRDIRCYVVGGKFLGSAVRKNKNSFKSNLAQGGIPLKFDADDNIKALAISVSNAIGCDICGVDILFDKDGLYTVCEVNSVPGFKSLKALFGLNDYNIFINLIKDLTE